MVYGIDILKVTALNLKMDLIRRYPLVPIQLHFVTYCTHFYSSCGFFSLRMLKIAQVALLYLAYSKVFLPLELNVIIKLGCVT